MSSLWHNLLSHFFIIGLTPELVSELLSRCYVWGERELGLNQLLVVYYVIALSLLRRLNLAAVLRHLVCGLRWLWSNPCLRLPTAAALVYRRRNPGTPVLRHLFQRVCRPMAPYAVQRVIRFPLHERRPERNGDVRMVYGARSCHCRPCLLRTQCQESATTIKPRQVSTLVWPLSSDAPASPASPLNEAPLPLPEPLPAPEPAPFPVL